MAAALPSQKGACDSLCLQEGRTCLVRRRYLRAGFSRLWDQDPLSGPSGPPPRPQTPPAFLSCMCPGDALGHMRRCRPTLQPPAPPPDCDLTRAPPTRCELPTPGPNLKSSAACTRSPPGGSQPGVHGWRPTDRADLRILPEWQYEGRNCFSS